MKKKWLKKGSAVLLAAAMVLSLFPGMKGTLATVQAAENETPTSGYWTDAEGLKNFSLDEANDTEGKIIFGQNGSGAAQQWKIAGVDSGIKDSKGNVTDNIILFAASPLGISVFEDNYTTNKTYDSNWNCTYMVSTSGLEVFPNHYGASDLRTVLNNYMRSNNYFSESEKTKMNKTTIYTDDKKNGTTYSVTDTLYAPYGDYDELNDKYVTVGTNTSDSLNGGVKIDVSKWGNGFWLRSTLDNLSDYALVANKDKYVDSSFVFGSCSVVPAFNLNLSDVSFASAAEAASSTGYKANSEMTPNTYTLRYTYTTGTDSAVISSDGAKVTVTNAKGKYLMVQNRAGVYAMAIDSDSKTVNASDITMGSALDNFNNCKVWIESTDADRITTAKMAVTAINSIEITDITSPSAGSTFDTEAACATTGVSNTTPTVTWTPNDTTAGYNTTYTASVTLTADAGYEFASGVTATVNGQNATSVTKNQDGGITVSYSYKTAPKTVSNAYFATVDDLKDCYNISDGTIGKIRFGLNGSDSRLWAICGADGSNLALLSTSEFARAAYGSTSKYSESDFVKNINTYLGKTYFSAGETSKMADVTVKTNEPIGKDGNEEKTVTNKLYLPNSKDQKSQSQTTIYVGSSNDIAIDVTKLDDVGLGNIFWLRSSIYDNSSRALMAYPGYSVLDIQRSVNYSAVSVVPAFNLNLSSDIFASAAEAASSSYNGYKENSGMTENTYTLRYKSTGSEEAVISRDGTKIKVTGADGKYLMVQNSTGVYALAIDDNSKTVNASDIVMGSDASAALTNFNNCKVWLESTDAGRITTAKMATQATVTTINSIEITDITSPVAGSAFDTEAACATTGVSTKTTIVTWTQGGEPVTGNAGYNTTYTASVTLTAEDDYGYKFASNVTATVNGQNVTSVTKNQDGTLTVTYEFPATAKATYTITAGAGGTHELSTDGTLTITCDGALDKLTGIYVDDKFVDAANYTLKSGSTILTFKADYLNTLSVGTHKVKFQYSDGSAESTFVIKAASSQDTTTSDTTQDTTTPSEKDDAPKAGDSTPIAWLFIIAVISGAGVLYFGRKRKTVR